MKFIMKNNLFYGKKWEDRIKINNNSQEKSLKIMRKVNPFSYSKESFGRRSIKACNRNE